MKDLTKGNEAKLIFQFAVPMLLGNVFQQLYQVVNSIIVGRYLGEKALAAVGASFPIIFTLIALIIGFGIGASVVISQYFGARDYEKVRRASDTINIFLFFAGIGLSLIGILSSNWLFNLLQLPQELMHDAKLYLNIYLSGLVVMFGFNGTTAILRGIGDSKTPLYFLIISVVINIFLDLLFILVFKWGIAGAAISTVISQLGAFATAIYYLNRNHHIIRFDLKHFNFDKLIFLQSVKIGLPTGIQQTFVALGSMALMGIVNTYGTVVIAGYTAAMRIDQLALLPAMNFSAALSGFVGQNMGAKQFDRIKAGLRATFIMSAAVCFIITIIVVVWGDNIVGMFTTNPEVIKVGHKYLIIVSLFYIFFSTMFTYNGLLRGAGATLIPMFLTLFSLWLIRIPLAYFLSKHTSLAEEGIWWSIPIAWMVGTLSSYIYYKMGRWKTKGIIHKTDTEVLQEEVTNA
ncbi:MAG TPA: MATE family efflux transporter [Bacteroidales bacterium]|nr:MATE family efflux transporter [Bacteroidales bacterium]